MAEDFADDNDFSTPVTISSFTEGRSYGKGRGFIAQNMKNNALPEVGQSKKNYDWGTGNSTNGNSKAPTSNSNTNNDWGTGSGGQSNNANDDWGTGSGGQSNNANDDWGTGSGGLSNNTNDNWGTGNGGQSNNRNDDWGTGGGDTNGDWDSGNRKNRNSNTNDWGETGGSRGNHSRNFKDDNNDRRGGSENRRRNDNNHGPPKNRNTEGIDDEINGEEGVEKRPPVTYIPPERSTDDSELFNSGISAGINFNKYDNIPIEVSGADDVPPPIDEFSAAGLRTSLLTNIKKSGYKKPTPVQKYSIPILMRNYDLMACAQTGSGKTAAYLIPIIHKLLEANDELHLVNYGCEPQVIILAPTRELVTQICWEAVKFGKDTVIKAISVYGGVSTMHQARQCEKGAHIIVATPGRLCDFVERGRIKFSRVRFVVLDEADRMLDAGFLSSMETVLGHETMVPVAERQTAMFSATFPSEVQNLAANFMRNYLFLTVGIVGGACDDVEQNFYEVEKKHKRHKLAELLNLDGGVSLKKKTLVFVETKKTADFIACYMSDNKFPSTSIHGDREQREREIALNDFKSGRRPILVATSVAARGLDIPEVAHVINYDLPKDIGEYVHRIGRTGRMGNKGKATSFYDPNFDSSLGPDIVRILTQAKQNIPDFLQCVSSGYEGGISSGFGSHDIRDDNAYGTNAAEPDEPW